ncbi:MAG: SpoIIE family protein phosphatase [Magnetococcus sp. MYC-9]
MIHAGTPPVVVETASPPRWRGWGITAKLILLLLAVSLLPMLGITYWNMQGAMVRVGHLEEENLKLLAISVAQRLDQWVKDSLLLVNFLAGDPEVIRLLSLPQDARGGELESVNQTVQHISRMNADVASAYVMDREGRFLVSSNPQVVGQLRPELDYFQEARTGATFVSNLRYGATSGHSGAYFARPVRNDSGQILGVAVIKLLGRVVQTIMEESGSRDITPFLVDRDGVIIHHPDPGIRFQSLRPLPAEKIQQLLHKQNLPVRTIASLDDPILAEQMLSGRPPGYVHHFAPGWRSHRVTGTAALSAHTWVVGMSEDEGRFTLPLMALFDDTMHSLLLVGGFMVALSLLIGRYLTRPLAVLTRASALLEQSFTRAGQNGRDEENMPTGIAQATNLKVLFTQENGLHSNDELGKLWRVFQKMAQEVIQRKELLDQLVMEKTAQLQAQNDKLAQARQRIDAELQIARAMQLAMLPSQFPSHPCYRLYATMRPALETGGDFYDFFALDAQRVGVVVADVSGKGVPAAFFMTISRTVLQSVGQKGGSPAQCLREVNNQLCIQNPMELFVTLFYGILDSRSGRFCYANGGHNPPCHLSAGGQVTALPSAGEMALGVLEEVEYQERSLQLSAHDTLFFFTDGVTEAFDGAGHAFGEERLMRVLGESCLLEPRELVERVDHALRRFIAGAEQSDDITCLALRYDAPPAGERAEVFLPEALPLPQPGTPWLVGAEKLLEERVCALAEIPLLAERLAALDAEENVAAAVLFQINLVLDEWLTNVLSYGFREGESPSVSVCLYRQAGCWILEVVDGGVPYNPMDKPAPDTESSVEERPVGGLGIHFMREMMDEVDYRWEDGYNRLLLVKAIHPLQGGGERGAAPTDGASGPRSARRGD